MGMRGVVGDVNEEEDEDLAYVHDAIIEVKVSSNRKLTTETKDLGARMAPSVLFVTDVERTRIIVLVMVDDGGRDRDDDGAEAGAVGFAWWGPYMVNGRRPCRRTRRRRESAGLRW